MMFRFQAGKKMPACRCGEGFSLNALKRGRAKGKKTSPSRSAPNPIRLDPSKTAGLRRMAETEVNQRFNLLKADVVGLIIGEDALSLNLSDAGDVYLFNAFCPTGQGGGSKNTCAARKGKGKQKKGKKGSSGSAPASGSAAHAHPPAPAPHGASGGLLARLKGAVAKGAMAVYGRMVLATPMMWKAMTLFTDVFDHPDDYKKFGYQPSLAHGPQTPDALKDAGSPIGTHLAAKIVTEVISRGIAFAKKAYAKRKARKAAVANVAEVFNANTMDLVLTIILHAINIVHSELGFNLLTMQELKAMFARGQQAKGISAGSTTEPTTNAGRWASLDDRGKVKAFKDWIKQAARTRVLNEWEQAWREIGDAAYKKGAERAYDDTKAPRKALIAAGDKDALKVYEGSRAEFLRTSIDSTEAAQRLTSLSARVHNDMEGVVDHLSTVMTRLLHDGLQKRQTPKQIARTLSQAVDALGKGRAMTVVRTEVVRAHAEGQLDTLQALGVTDVGVMVEWRGNPATICSLCAPLVGIVVKIDEARGMIPRHPNCTCAWLPANTGEPTSSQKRNKGRIDKAITKSQKEEGSTEWGPGEPISRKRPTRNEEDVPVSFLITPAMVELDRYMTSRSSTQHSKRS